MESSTKVQVRVDTGTCVGSGTCAMVDPEHFTLVDGKSRVSSDPLEHTEELEDAILDCPVQAISSSPA